MSRTWPCRRRRAGLGLDAVINGAVDLGHHKAASPPYGAYFDGKLVRFS